MLLVVEMALTEWGLMAYLPSDYCSLLGTSSKVDPLDCLNKQN